MSDLSHLRPLDLNHLLVTQPQPFDFVLPGLLGGTVGLLFSAGGTGKSSFILQAALQVATGRDLLGLGVMPRGRVVLFSGEDGLQALHHRLYALSRHFPLSPGKREDAATNLAIVPTVGTSIDLLSELHQAWLADQIRGCRLAVFDTLTRFHSADENSATDAKQIMFVLERLAQQASCALVFLHHVSKSSSTAGLADQQQSARGSSVFVDNARWASYVLPMSAAEYEQFNVAPASRTKYIKWNVAKQNYSAPIPDLWLERHKGGVLAPACFNGSAGYALVKGKRGGQNVGL